MTRDVIIEEFIRELEPSSIPDEFILKITFWRGDDKFRVERQDFEEFRRLRPKGIRNVSYYLNLPKIVESVNCEVNYVLEQARIRGL